MNFNGLRTGLHLFLMTTSIAISGCGYQDSCHEEKLDETEDFALREFVHINGLDSLHPFKYASRFDIDCETSHIHRITAAGSGIDSIPESFIRFRYASEIFLDHNELRSLPDQIVSLNPSFVSIGWNHLCSVPEDQSRWLDAHDSLWRKSQECIEPQEK